MSDSTDLPVPPQSVFRGASKKTKDSKGCSNYSLFLLFIVFGITFTFSLNLIHDQAMASTIGKKRHEFYKQILSDQFHDGMDDKDMESSIQKIDTTKEKNSNAPQQESKKVLGKEFTDHKLAGLSCEKFGGPLDEKLVKEMVYWEDIPSDSDYESPFKVKKKGQVKYMTFEPDGGGWNNIRMAMETVVVMAHATGRTLVMPPEQVRALFNALPIFVTFIPHFILLYIFCYLFINFLKGNVPT